MPKIKFIRENREIEVEPGANLRQAARKNGIQLYPGIFRLVNCHGFGQCGECRVYIKKGMENTSKPGFLERLRTKVSFFHIEHDHEVRLACQTEVNGDIEVYTQPEFNWFGRKNMAGG